MAQLQLHLPTARSLFRGYLTQKLGDNCSCFRFTVLVVNRNYSEVTGMEVGVGGVAPMPYQGRHVGLVSSTGT
jgi:hypothetical protein